MTSVVAVANQKGGVAKTTTVQSLGAALVERGRRVLLVDLDPQGSLTYSMGADPDTLERSIHDVMVHRTPAADVVIHHEEGDLLPATIDLAGTEVYLASRTGREKALGKGLEPLLGAYDSVLIDCPPSLGVLTINGLTAARQVLIPLQCETLSYRGVGQLLETIGEVREYTNPKLAVLGVVATMYDPRTRLAKDTLAKVGAEYDLPLLEPPVPKSVRVAEAPARGSSVLRSAPRSAPAAAYRELAATLAELG